MTINHGNHNPPEWQRFLPMWEQADLLAKEAASQRDRRVRFGASVVLLALFAAAAVAAIFIH